jgi:hypothetical protein
MEWLILALVVGVLLFGAWLSCSNEIDEWNEGICPESGEPWVLIDNSEAGRLYSDGRGNTIWMSWFYP